MKSYHILFSLSFAIGIQAQSTATQQYNNVCPALHGQEHEISPGYKVKYLCNTRGTGGPAHSYINSPAACAALCESSPECAASTWAYQSRKCQLHTQAEPAGAYAERLHMQHIEEDPLGPDPEEEDPLGQDDCAEQNQQIEALESDLAECFSGNGASSTQLPPYSPCHEGGADQVLTIGNRQFKQKCNVWSARGQRNIYKTVKHGLTDPECALICALDAQCQSVYHSGGTSTAGDCELHNYNIDNLLVPSSQGYGGPSMAYVPA